MQERNTTDRHKVRVAEIVAVPGAELKAGYAESGEVGQHLTRHRWSPHFDGLVAARVKNQQLIRNETYPLSNNLHTYILLAHSLETR